MDYLLGIFTGAVLTYWIVYPIHRLILRHNDLTWCKHFDLLVERQRQRNAKMQAADAEEAIKQLMEQANTKQ